MNAKAKALDIFNKMSYALRTDETMKGYYTDLVYAKECSYVIVQEHIDNLYFIKSFKDRTEHLRYWNEVKDELNKLL